MEPDIRVSELERPELNRAAQRAALFLDLRPAIARNAFDLRQTGKTRFTRDRIQLKGFGPTVKVAVFRAYYTDVNARLQSHAIALGGYVDYLTPEEGRPRSST
jgi:hypothetical protein